MTDNPNDNPLNRTPLVVPTPARFPELDRARTRSVRLIISIPVLTLLIVLGSSTVLYVYLMDFAEAPSLSTAAKETIERAALTVLLISTFISALSGVVGYLFARQIVKPIKDVVKTMDALAEGDFSTKLKPIQLGEFGQLGMTFNRMVDQLNKLFEERDRQLRESFGGAHMVLDQKGTVTQVDQSAARLFGRDASELMGTNLLGAESEVPLLRRNPLLLRALRELIEESRSGHTANRSVTIRDEQGNAAARYLVTTLCLEGDHGTAPRFLLEVRDITGIAGFYEQMQRADRLAAIGTLATGIAHEIRNPLASIRGMVQLLAESSTEGPDGLPEVVQAEYHTRIQKEVDRLEKLVAGIMDFSQAAETPLEEVDIGIMLREVIHSAELQAGEGADKVGVEWDLDIQLPQARLQAERLRQALHNLAINAFQHCLAHAVGPIRVQTLFLPVNNQRPIIICIANPGEAIEEPMRERLFEPFFTTKPEGTGLGLPIAYQTISANGGILELECEDGEIQFWIRLPIEVVTHRSDSKIVPKPSARAIADTPP